MSRPLISVCLILAFASFATAGDEAISKYRDFLPNQILEMSEKERSSSVPMMFIGAANLAASDYGHLSIQMDLNTLMYEGLADFETASDLGEEPTGRLTVWQIHTLGYRAARQNLTHVSFFPFDFGGTELEGYARVKGTAKILDERIAYPINHVTIECKRDDGICSYIQIALILPDENSWAQSYSVLNVADEHYRITRWENHQIDAVPIDNSKCRTNQLSLNFSTSEFFEIARNNTTGECNTLLGVSIPKLERPRISQIVDGREIVAAEFKHIKDEAYGYLSSEFRSKVSAVSGKSNK